jgi:hypothetical protein
MRIMVQVSVLVLGEWLLVTPPGNDVTRPQNEWHQEQSFDTLEQCVSYRERQADALIKKMETVPEGSPDHKIYEPAATRYLLGKCILTEKAPT